MSEDVEELKEGKDITSEDHNKDFEDLNRIKGVVAENERKVYILDGKIEVLTSKIYSNIFSPYLANDLRLLAELKKERNEAKSMIKTANLILKYDSHFEKWDLMVFFAKLISAFEEKEYECTVNFIPSGDKNQNFILNYVISEKSTNYGLLETVPDIIKMQDAQDYKGPFIAKLSEDKNDKSEFMTEIKLNIFNKFPYLFDAFQALLSYKIGHPDKNKKEAIKEILNNYITKFQNLKQEEKTQIMKLAL